MSKDDPSINEDVVRELAKILNETDLTEIEYEKGECRIRVARQITMQTMQASAAPLALAAPSAVTPIPTVAEETGPIDLSNHPGALKSPMVGNAYLSAAPGADPFVKIGDAVKAGDSVLIIEAMKVMNQIKAHKNGVVKQILLQDADPVEFDQVLLIIE
ncbi:MAG: acetyl-CoA carboxylase biotin carboxyl carrier protein [Alphaproteobacteria bacterium]|nr:acetyl-CoA carboxylase biotin carboxyl carrier protein [Alphaproteobacteria bacterium]NCQ66382.1 acetyl-CoA carboxylase biotin carboxyl carrier protein [Alphaproteobacteria bacterium]NCT06867.1 acetyl-CoA carboxylase biotin carboxyl carrier protein [Alphaproteobacteria bacterium]